MTPWSSQDPLVALWQTSPKTDTSSLLQDLQRVNNSHRRLSRIVLAILCGASLLLIQDAMTNRTVTHVALCVAWNLSLISGVLWYRRAGCKRVDAISLDTVRLLKFMIARAKRDLQIARYLYAGAPCGALAGFTIARLTGFGAAPGVVGVLSHARLLRTGGAFAVLITMMLVGFAVERDRRLQIRGLTETLESIQEDL